MNKSSIIPIEGTIKKHRGFRYIEVDGLHIIHYVRDETTPTVGWDYHCNCTKVKAYNRSHIARSMWDRILANSVTPCNF